MRNSGQHLIVSEKKMIMNLVHYHLNRNCNDSLSTVIKLLSEMSGVSENIFTECARNISPAGLQQLRDRLKKHCRKAVLIEKSEIVSSRYRYLPTLDLSVSRRRLQYDVPWVNIGHSVSKEWV